MSATISRSASLQSPEVGVGKIGMFILSPGAVFRIRIRIRLDPYHLAGSGSTSGNVDLDPGSKKKS